MPACSVGLLGFFFPYNHAEYDLFCQLLVLLADADALWWFPLAAEEMLLVETSFSNRVVALLSFKEMWEWVRLCAGGCRDFQYLDSSVQQHLLCVCSQKPWHAVYGGKWGFTWGLGGWWQKERADVDVGELVRSEQCWQNSTSKENLVLLISCFHKKWMKI